MENCCTRNRNIDLIIPEKSSGNTGRGVYKYLYLNFWSINYLTINTADKTVVYMVKTCKFPATAAKINRAKSHGHGQDWSFQYFCTHDTMCICSLCRMNRTKTHWMYQPLTISRVALYTGTCTQLWPIVDTAVPPFLTQPCPGRTMSTTVCIYDAGLCASCPAV